MVNGPGDSELLNVDPGCKTAVVIEDTYHQCAVGIPVVAVVVAVALLDDGSSPLGRSADTAEAGTAGEGGPMDGRYCYLSCCRPVAGDSRRVGPGPATKT